MPGQASSGEPLADAIERYRRMPGAYGNAYDWYRRSAVREGVARRQHSLRVDLGAG